MLYSTLILPYYQYCNVVWAGNYPSTLHKLFLLQNRAKHIISAADYRAHAVDLFKTHRQLTLVDINKLHIAVFVFKSQIICYHLNSLIILGEILSYTVTSFVQQVMFIQ